MIGALLLVVMFIGFVLLDEPPLHRETPLSQTSEVGSELNLYGKTLDNKDFDWESFRGKYVLVKFTATWCGPCKLQIPGLREAYKKYHDKGFEIVSVYIWEQKDDAETIKQYVELEKLPWVIISEPLTKKAGLPPLDETFGIQGVPTMVLVDKEGKVLPADANLQQKLKEMLDK